MSSKLNQLEAARAADRESRDQAILQADAQRRAAEAEEQRLRDEAAAFNHERVRRIDIKREAVAKAAEVLMSEILDLATAVGQHAAARTAASALAHSRSTFGDCVYYITETIGREISSFY